MKTLGSKYVKSSLMEAVNSLMETMESKYYILKSIRGHKRPSKKK